MAAALCRFTAFFLSKVMVTVVLPAISGLEPNNLLIIIFNLDRFGFHFLLTHAHTQTILSPVLYLGAE